MSNYAINCVFDFEVEQPHIDAGIKADCSRCPVARAMLDCRADAADIEAGPFGCFLHVTGESDVEVWRFDDNTASKILHFDGHGRMQPFTARATLTQRAPRSAVHIV